MPRAASAVAAVGVGLNLLLGYYKYSGFFLAQVQSTLGHVGLGGALSAPEVVLPIGISFFTFQGVSYLIDLCT